MLMVKQELGMYESITLNGNSTSTLLCGSASSTANNVANSNTTTVSILFGAVDLGNKAFSSNPVKIKVGDTVTWKNDDRNFHLLESPPTLRSGTAGMNFNSDYMDPGETFSCIFTKPGGFHYSSNVDPNNTGVVIVVEDDQEIVAERE